MEAFDSWDHETKAIVTLGRRKSPDQPRVRVDRMGGGGQLWHFSWKTKKAVGHWKWMASVGTRVRPLGGAWSTAERLQLGVKTGIRRGR